MMTKEERQEKIGWLRGYLDLKKEIKGLEAERAIWREQAVNINSKLSDMPRGTNKIGYAEILSEIDEIEGSITKKISESIKKYKAIEKAIDTIEVYKLRELLRLRYFHGNSYEKMAVKMKYSYENIRKLHNIGLRIIQFEKEYLQLPVRKCYDGTMD